MIEDVCIYCMRELEFEEKLMAAQSNRTRAHCLELLHYVRKEKLREPDAVASIGKLLLTNHSWGLGDECTDVETSKRGCIFVFTLS